MTLFLRFCVPLALVALATSGTWAGSRAPVWSDTNGDGMIYSWLTDLTDLEWQPEAGYDGWNVYRGKLSELKTSGVYTRDPISWPGAERWCDLTVRLLPDPKHPAPGATFYYLVTGSAGGVEGDLGTDGSGAPRPHDAPCP